MDRELSKYVKDGKETLAQLKKRALLDREWYSLRSILGCWWAYFIFLLGGREAGKSYAVTNFYVGQWKKYGRPFYWLRLTDSSQKKLLKNNAEKLIDPDLKRKYNIETETNGDGVYEIKRNKDNKVIEKRLMCRVLALSTFYNDKGSGLFDKDFLNDPNMYYNICLDEMNRESNEKNTFDIVYAFTNQLENLVRSTKQKLRIICIGNTLEEASDILTAFEFLPEEFGRYYIKKKRAVIEYMEPSKKYLERRQGTVADILSPTSSTFTNKIEVDKTLIYKGRLRRPNYFIYFRNGTKFTVWDNNVITPYNGEKCNCISMRPYLDSVFNTEARDAVIAQFDGRAYKFRNLVTQKFFKKELELLKPRK